MFKVAAYLGERQKVFFVQVGDSYAALLLRHAVKILTTEFEIRLLKCEYDATRPVFPGKQEGQL